MSNVIILSGVSGSGKSTKALALCEGAEVVSADHYFMVGEEYKFDGHAWTEGCYYDDDDEDRFCPICKAKQAASRLSLAHGECFRSFIEKLREGHGHDTVVVDNTNTTAVEIAPYVLGAQAFGYHPSILTFMCESEDDVKMCAARNSHGVSFAGVLRQHSNLKQRKLPPWWHNTTLSIHR